MHGHKVALYIEVVYWTGGNLNAIHVHEAMDAELQDAYHGHKVAARPQGRTC